MTPEQRELVKNSWKLVNEVRELAADLFYKKLFELNPDLENLFKADIQNQGAQLMKMIDAAVGKLDDLPSLVPIVKKLGARHNGYGVKDQDYETVANALIWTLEQGLGEAFTPEVKQAWVVVYSLLADTMKKASEQAA